jgi:hypothetical protein
LKTPVYEKCGLSLKAAFFKKAALAEISFISAKMIV